MAEFKVVQIKPRAKRGLPSYTFLVDGQPSLYWCPTKHAVDRVISRLMQGRSREAFGDTITETARMSGRSRLSKNLGRGQVYPVASEQEAEEITMASGRKKTREQRPQWGYELDGQKCEELYATEQEAKVACAVRAFMTRGKLGRLKEVEAKLAEQFPDKPVKVEVSAEKHKVVATVDGQELHVGFEADGVTLKPVTTTPE